MKTGDRMRIGVKLALAAMLLPLVVACSGHEGPRAAGATALIVGGRNNMPIPSLTKTAKDWISEAVLSGDRVLIIAVSGRPRVVLDETTSTDCDSDRACAAVARDYIAKTESRLRKVKADTTEADTLGGIMEAGRQFQTVDGPKHIVVVDSGLQTSGKLMLQEPGAFSASVDKIAAGLKDNPDFKTLSGTDILLTALGSTSGDQHELTPDRRTQLETMWQNLLRAAGATVSLDTTGIRNDSPDKAALPQVTVVPDEPVIDFKTTECFNLRADQIGFVPDQPTLLNESKTRDFLKPIAERLKKADVVVTVFGTTALPDDGNDLSEARAKKVIGILEDQGVAKGTMFAHGIGIKFAGYKPPFNSDGSFNETIAVQNRRVIIQPAGAICG